MTDLTYKQALTASMAMLAQNPAARFVGYGLVRGRAAGTMTAATDAQLVETPVAENLMVGIAHGLALAGLQPVVFVERMDFILNAADAIVNHLDKAALMSRSQFNPRVILRVVVGNRKKPLFTGATHVQDFSDAFLSMLRMPVFCLRTPEEVLRCYEEAARLQQCGTCSSMLVEYKDLM